MGGVLIGKENLIAAISLPTVIAIYDDNRDGVEDDERIDEQIQRAEAEVQSYIIGHYDGGDTLIDELLKSAAIDFLIAYSYRRHSEYARTYGKEASEAWAAGEKRMERVKAGIQRPPQADAEKRSATVGGVILERGPRMFNPSADGTHNGGDF